MSGHRKRQRTHLYRALQRRQAELREQRAHRIRRVVGRVAFAALVVLGMLAGWAWYVAQTFK